MKPDDDDTDTENSAGRPEKQPVPHFLPSRPGKQEPVRTAVSLERLAEENRKALDDLYSNPHAERRKLPPEDAGRRTVRRLGAAMAGSLLLGLLAGVYTLKTDGRDTPLAAQFDRMMASLLPADGAVTDSTPPMHSDPNGSATRPAEPVTSKSVTSVSLATGDADGQIRTRIPLMVDLETGHHADPVVIHVSGMPEASVLTKGTRQPDGTWRLTPGEQRGVYLVLTRPPDQPVNLVVAAIASETGNLAAPMQEIAVRLDRPPTNSASGQ